MTKKRSNDSIFQGALAKSGYKPTANTVPVIVEDAKGNVVAAHRVDLRQHGVRHLPEEDAPLMFEHAPDLFKEAGIGAMAEAAPPEGAPSAFAPKPGEKDKPGLGSDAPR